MARKIRKDGCGAGSDQSIPIHIIVVEQDDSAGLQVFYMPKLYNIIELPLIKIYQIYMFLIFSLQN